ncbi:ABC transporter substrate-binding protein [Cumulibacter manganitolerans]|uniref:ABC transporter substrate-binding protein n=1 Tax=Cumulibacter manganitolerans TaxID=1884992 RepID=UPI001296AA96|nr:ABC transporter substrate-binding protein [Cumulibacter manganitolerans]
MQKQTWTRSLVIGSIGLALVGCSTKAQSGSDSSGEAGSVKTGVGVTDDTITLGVLSDLSGPFKSGGLAFNTGHQIWLDEVNKAGGVCGRKIALDIQDHGYKADNAVPQYEIMRNKDLGLIQLLGTPVLAAIKTKIDSDQMLTTVQSVASNSLDTKSLISVTAPYDIEAINGLSYQFEKGTLKDGNTFGAVYIDNEAGQNMLSGAKAFAKQHDMQVVESAIGANDTDMTALVTKLKSAGVKVVYTGASSAATTSLAVQMKSQGLDVPLVGGSPTFAPTMLANAETLSALKDIYYVSTSTPPWTIETPSAEKVRAAYAAMNVTDPPSPKVFAGYLSGMLWQSILEHACTSGDLTRGGVHTALENLGKIDADGLSGTIDVSEPGAPTTRESYVLQLDENVEGGLTKVGDLKASEEAKKYKAPYEK